MFTVIKRKLKKNLSKKIIFQPDIYDIDLDKKKFESLGVVNHYKTKLFKENFATLCLLFNTDKGSFIHSIAPSFVKKEIVRTIVQTHDYAKHYDNIFINLRNKVKNICEIGVMSGASTAALYYYFPKSTIFALDINFQRFNIRSKRIIKKVVDQSNPVSLNNFIKKTKNRLFDIIVDDGSHVDNHIILTFEKLFPQLKKKGYYVIEDISNELTPKTMKILKDKKYLKKFKVEKIRIFKSEEGLNLLSKDGTKQNYIAFLKKK